MYKFKVYLLTAILISLVFVCPFFCQQSGNQINIENVKTINGMIFKQNEDTTLGVFVGEPDTNVNWIFIGNTKERGYPVEKYDTDFKYQQIIDSLRSHGYLVIDTVGKRKGGGHAR